MAVPADRNVVIRCEFMPSFHRSSQIEATSDGFTVRVVLRFNGERGTYQCLLGASDARDFIADVDTILSFTDPEERGLFLDGCPVRAWVEAGPVRWSGEGQPCGGNRVTGAALTVYSLLEQALEREPSVAARLEFENLWSYLRASAPVRPDIVDGVRHVRFFARLTSTHMAEVTEALDSLVSVERCTVEFDNCQGIAGLLYPSFIDFARRCPTAIWVVREGLQPLVEGFGVPADRIDVHPPARASTQPGVRRLPRLL
jgi:hypothetical protein